MTKSIQARSAFCYRLKVVKMECPYFQEINFPFSSSRPHFELVISVNMDAHSGIWERGKNELGKGVSRKRS
jgi:hypothetical protein